jgi:hypothetical protein
MITQNEDIADITISDQPLEDIIATIFKGKGAVS